MVPSPEGKEKRMDTKVGFKGLIDQNLEILKSRAKRLKVLRASRILPEGDSLLLSVEVGRALKILNGNPNRVLDWISPEELALCVAFEEVSIKG